MRYLIVLSLALGSTIAKADPKKDQIIMAQQASIQALERRIQALEANLTRISSEQAAQKARFDQVVSTDNRWLGQNSGLKGDRGPQGPGATTPTGPQGFVEIRTEEQHVLHIGPGGICLYATNGERWCR